MTKNTDSQWSAILCAMILCLYFPASFAQNNEKNGDFFPKGLQGDVKHGKVVFEAQCARCHGVSGDGKGLDVETHKLKALNFRTGGFRANYGRRDIFTSIALGKLATHMPSWLKEFADQEVADVSEYIYQRFVLQTIDVSY